jgi:hypothetical protein
MQRWGTERKKSPGSKNTAGTDTKNSQRPQNRRDEANHWGEAENRRRTVHRAEGKIRRKGLVGGAGVCDGLRVFCVMRRVSLPWGCFPFPACFLHADGKSAATVFPSRGIEAATDQGASGGNLGYAGSVHEIVG